MNKVAVFQRRHYEAIADVLRHMAIMPATCEVFADMFERDNPNFDRERFMSACRNKEEI